MLNKQTAKLIAIIAQNLPEMSDEAMQRYIENPKRVQMILKDGFNIFRTIVLGTGLKTADDFRRALKDANMDCDDSASDLLNDWRFQVSAHPVKVDLVALTVAELGLGSRASYLDICNRGKQLGYKLCWSEYAVQLRLQYQDQPKGEVLIMAMEAIHDSENQPYTLNVGHYDSMFLSVRSARNDDLYHGESIFVFKSYK